ncbi:MAG: hypothetical protein KC416_11120 [Myxococcales bacterium]|nr:hypothetical protein [Myxococcales bacterium]
MLKNAGDAAMDASMMEDGGGAIDAGNDGGSVACVPLEGDYRPGETDSWDACISDDGTYTPVDNAASTIARIDAFEEIRDLILTPKATPTSQDFSDAYLKYTQAEGLESRVERRYDPHEGTAIDQDAVSGIDCGNETQVTNNPDFCVGPARIGPAIDDAFNAGIATPSGEQAGIIEGGLLWFFYISQYKESLTCSATVKDCDSSWAYTTGGGARGEENGFVSYVRSIDGDAADRIYDGALAVRCWRDLDMAVGYDSVDEELRDAARDQYDRAALDGAAVIVLDRLNRALDATGDERAYYLASAETLANAIYSAMESRSMAARTKLESALTADTVDNTKIQDAMDAIGAVFPIACMLE